MLVVPIVHWQTNDRISGFGPYFEAYVRYRHRRPPVVYALNYFERHIRRFDVDSQTSGLLQRFCEQLANLKSLVS